MLERVEEVEELKELGEFGTLVGFVGFENFAIFGEEEILEDFREVSLGRGVSKGGKYPLRCVTWG